MKAPHSATLLIFACSILPAAASITLTPVSRIFANTPAPVFDATAAEIPAYDAASRRLFVVNTSTQSVDVTDLSDPAAPVALPSIPLGADPNSVAVSNGVVAVAVANPSSRQGAGEVRFFNIQDYSAMLASQTVGSLPDMLAFTPDGSRLVVANEGEPNFYGGPASVDPEGSVSILNVSFPSYGQISVASVATAGFGAFNGQEAALRAKGVRIFGPGASVAQDLEPEYVSISKDSTRAYVTLQENNAIATVDLASGQVLSVSGLGTRNNGLPANAIDPSDRDNAAGNGGAISLVTLPVRSFYAPDGITTLERGGRTYLITANEGDYRDYSGTAVTDAGGTAFTEERRLSTLDLDNAEFGASETILRGNGPGGAGRLNVTTANGDTDGDGDYDTIYNIGTRSFSVWEANADGSISLRYDSGSLLESTLAARYPANFNANSTNNNADARSPAKGPEPEAVTLGEIEGIPYAFIATERASEIFGFNLDDPLNPKLEFSLNTRDFTTTPGAGGAGGDLAPEGMVFVPASESPNGLPLLIVSYETSGTSVVFAVVPETGSATLLVMAGTALLTRRRRKN